MKPELEKIANTKLKWGFSKELKDFIKQDTYTKTDTMNLRFAKYIDGIGELLNIDFYYRETNTTVHDVDIEAYTKQGNNKDAAEITISNGRNFFRMNAKFPNIKYFNKYRGLMLEVASIPGVSAYGNIDQKAGYDMLEHMKKIDSVPYHVIDTKSLILALVKFKEKLDK